MTENKLVILGGSSPFTVALLNEFRGASDHLPPMDLVLFGRNRSNLELVAHYADALLSPTGWRVQVAVHLEDALAGADIVVHQIRYGGLEEREAGEDFCSRFGLIADETLGAAALRIALLSVPALRRSQAAFSSVCPDAWLLNLTNPLSAVTAVLAVEPSHTVGLCELPQQTAYEAANIFGLRLQDIDWEYCGLNHRGFIHGFRHGARDLLNELPRILGNQTIGGIAAEQIAELNAIPVKYYQLLLGSFHGSQGRSRFLGALRRSLVGELRNCWTQSPPSLGQRDLSWHRHAVAPMIRALNAAEPETLVVNVVNNGLVEEVKARVSSQGVRVIPSTAPSGKVAELLSNFRRHEHAFVGAMLKPSLETVAATLAADPTIPREIQDEVATALWRDVEGKVREPVSVL